MSGRTKPAARAIRVNRKTLPTETRTNPSPVSRPADRPVIVGEVMERSVGNCPPVEFTARPTAFPVPVHRQESNLGRRRTEMESGIDKMSKKEIVAAQKELKARLKPETIEFLKSRGMEKQKQSTASYFRNREVPGIIGRLKFSLDGEVVGWLTAEEFRNSPLVEETALHRDSILPNESYTLLETVALLWSTFPTHKTAGLQLLRNALTKCRSAPNRQIVVAGNCPELEKGVEWIEVWKFVLFDLDLCTVLRQLLRERSLSLVQNTLQVLQILVSLTEEQESVVGSRANHPLTSWPCVDLLPLQRPSSRFTWEVATAETAPRSFLLMMKQQIEDKMLEDFHHVLKSFPAREILLSVVSLLQTLASLGSEFAREISNYTKIISILKEKLETGLMELQIQVLVLLGRLLEAYPPAVQSLHSERVPDVLRSLLCGLVDQPKNRTVLELKKTGFRIWRFCCLCKQSFISMDDLFPVFYTHLDPSEFQLEDLETTCEIYLCLSAALGSPQTSQICPLSQRCASSIVNSSLQWLRPQIFSTILLEESACRLWLALYDCLAAASLYLESCFGQSLLSCSKEFSNELNAFLEKLKESQEALNRFEKAGPNLKRRFEVCKTHLFCSLKRFSDAVDLKPVLKTKKFHSIKGIKNLTDFDELLAVQEAANWVNFSLQSLDPESQGALETILELLTELPPGFETTAVPYLTSVLTPASIKSLVKSPENIWADLQQEEVLQDPVLLSKLLLDGLLTTWFGGLDPNKFDRKNPVVASREQNLFLGRNYALSSMFPLTREYLFYPMKTADSQKQKQDPLLLWKAQFRLLIYFESQISSWLRKIPSGLKLKLLIQFVFLSDEEIWRDVFFQHASKHLLQLYVDDLMKMETTQMTEWDLEFMENLLLKFCLVSDGDVLFGSVVALFFLRKTTVDTKTFAWKQLAENKALHLIPCIEYWIGKQEYYSPDSLKSIILKSKEEGLLEKTERLNSGLAQWITTFL